jgi:hypothetical protein
MGIVQQISDRANAVTLLSADFVADLTPGNDVIIFAENSGNVWGTDDCTIEGVQATRIAQWDFGLYAAFKYRVPPGAGQRTVTVDAGASGNIRFNAVEVDNLTANLTPIVVSGNAFIATGEGDANDHSAEYSGAVNPCAFFGFTNHAGRTVVGTGGAVAYMTETEGSPIGASDTSILYKEGLATGAGSVGFNLTVLTSTAQFLYMLLEEEPAAGDIISRMPHPYTRWID